MPDSTDIIVSPNGPLSISGSFIIKDGQGKEFDFQDERPSHFAAADCQETNLFAMDLMERRDSSPL